MVSALAATLAALVLLVAFPPVLGGDWPTSSRRPGLNNSTINNSTNSVENQKGPTRPESTQDFVELPFTAKELPLSTEEPRGLFSSAESAPTTVPGGSLQWLGGFTVNFTEFVGAGTGRATPTLTPETLHINP
jgi:hypothetical protein